MTRPSRRSPLWGLLADSGSERGANASGGENKTNEHKASLAPDTGTGEGFRRIERGSIEESSEK
jgi:hypothetical protein